MVSVTADENQQDRITDIMERYNPIDIDQRAEAWRAEGYRGYDPQAPSYNRDEAAREREPAMRPVERGGSRVFRIVSEQPLEQQMNSREEHVRVDRRPANRPATEADFRPAEQVIEVTEITEGPVIAKEARVVEEVVVGKESTQRTEKVGDKVRGTHVNVENMKPGQVRQQLSACRARRLTLTRISSATSSPVTARIRTSGTRRTRTRINTGIRWRMIRSIAAKVGTKWNPSSRQIMNARIRTAPGKE